MTVQIFDDRSCELGEGPLWHPLRNELFWFDILNCRLLSRGATGPREWTFNRMVSAAGWIDADTLLIASETNLIRFDLKTGAEHEICALEADRRDTRSNDGRTDPQGGFWIGTMGLGAETGAGSIYRWYRGELRRLHDGLTVPNAICFSPDRDRAYFSDTRARQVFSQPIDALTGWPTGPAELFIDLRATDGRPEEKPDGAITDTEGCLWIALWGSACVARFSPDGTELSRIPFPTGHTSCPAFGGPDMSTLFVTTARQNMPIDRADWHERAGAVISVRSAGCGRAVEAVRM